MMKFQQNLVGFRTLLEETPELSGGKHLGVFPQEPIQNESRHEQTPSLYNSLKVGEVKKSIGSEFPKFLKETRVPPFFEMHATPDMSEPTYTVSDN
ncbi:hypothetical protein Pmar_PMAR024172 [Perkinsus marinus ATCC 50983]|uniref:Uncharacterized protein n=1 Tax=Perkinsus marinus (strain ATCC 50983 / TXsc) TaxID=423536 RepID=C5L2D6_PERM5|nr:hypothetical protein Pmar_PMAR024172 [Perkinsus marinus ATCC 50983]EER09148.1 hypothetical protein Pmar_PMAR024172 [Perkinsus marinus ATCC 50983]|eukprot:XP_002777332.1 hypothetical protein Pmar_PMAR024172 [Perkinsus marinus ATCC 50983]